MFSIVVIDDEYIVREGLKRTIDWESLECQVIGEAEDGDEGLKVIETKKPDIVITDIRMPGKDGLEMISCMKELKNDCKIIIITGFRDFSYAQQAVKLGAFRFLLKPTKNIELIDAVNSAIEEIKEERKQQKYYRDLERQVRESYGLKSGTTEESREGSEEEKYQNIYLVNAIEYMKANYHKNPTLQDVADHLYVSTWHLSKLFSKHMGLGFTDVLNNIRIEEAKEMLMDPRNKVYEVAQSVGFKDVAYFNKIFKKHTGLTPGSYKHYASNE